jgi:hypothetical protein
MLFTFIIAVYSENHAELMNALSGGKMENIIMLQQVVHVVTTVL